MDAAAHYTAACCELVSSVIHGSGQVRLKLNGTSMVPSLWPGDVVTVHYRPVGDLQPGQIVLYRRDGTLTAHRMRGISQGQIVLCGDSLSSCDPPVSSSEILGEVTDATRGGRAVSLNRTLSHRVVSWCIQRSDFLRHITLRVGSAPWSIFSN